MAKVGLFKIDFPSVPLVSITFCKFGLILRLLMTSFTSYWFCLQTSIACTWVLTPLLQIKSFSLAFPFSGFILWSIYFLNSQFFTCMFVYFQVFYIFHIFRFYYIFSILPSFFTFSLLLYFSYALFRISAISSHRFSVQRMFYLPVFTMKQTNAFLVPVMLKDWWFLWWGIH